MEDFICGVCKRLVGIADACAAAVTDTEDDYQIGFTR
jgi:hypothetical protein